jgi:peptidoglycan/LPS O-acetylase OafA/YrhL
MKVEKLEAIRGFAALYIVGNHLVAYSVLNNALPKVFMLFFRFGQEAVILFFLLSGFVIYLSESKSTGIDFPRYFLKRFVRIYPILIITFILSILVAIINQHQFGKEDVRILLGNILMMQDLPSKPGCITWPFLDNYPLWTLSYECGFYLMFYPVYIFFVKEKTIKMSSTYVVLCISLLGWLVYMLFPHHIFLVVAYFSLWWTGVACAQIYLQYKTFTLKTLTPALVSLIVMTIVTSIPYFRALINGDFVHYLKYPVITFRHYLVSLIFILLALAWWRIKPIGFNVLLGWFKVFAPISYAIYVIHIGFITVNMPGINPYMALPIRVVLIFLVAYLLEIKLQPVFNKLFLTRRPQKSDHHLHIS